MTLFLPHPFIALHERRKPAFEKILALGDAHRTHPRYQGCVGHWLMGEGGGTTLYDVSGYGNHGTFTNGPLWTIGRFGPAVSFNGTSACVDIANEANFDFVGRQFTVGGWFKTTQTGVLQNIIGKALSLTTGQYQWLIGITTGNKLLVVMAACDGTDVYTLFSTDTINDGRWHYFSVMYDTAPATENITFYLDNVLQTTVIVDLRATQDYCTTGSGRVMLGALFSTTPGRFFSGELDDIRIYNRALTRAEISSLYTAPFLEWEESSRRRVWPVQAGVAGITGTLTQTLAAATLAATGVLPIVGTTARTLAAATLAATSTLAIQGTSSVTLDNAILSASSTVSIIGIVAQTLDDATLSATGGAIPTHGTLAQTLDDTTLSSAGAVALTGTLVQTLAPATLAAAAALANTGTLATTLDDAALNSAGALVAEGTGSLSVDLADATLDATGMVRIAGTTARTLANATLSSTGTVAIKGTTARTLADATLDSAGKIAIEGTLAKTLDAATLDSTGTVTPTAGTVAATLDDATVASTGGLTIHGTTAVQLDSVTTDASGTVAIAGSLAKTLAAATLDSSGAVAISGSLTRTLDDATLAAFGFEEVPPIFVTNGQVYGPSPLGTVAGVRPFSFVYGPASTGTVRTR